MTEVWPDIEHETWYARCPRCKTVVGPCESGVEAEVEADFHCPGEGGPVPALIGGGPQGELYAEVEE